MFLQLDNLDSVRDYWAVEDNHGSNLKEKDLSTISSLVSQHYLGGGSPHSSNFYLVELARDVDINEVAFEICARLVNEGYVVLLPSGSKQAEEELIGQQKRFVCLVIDPRLNHILKGALSRESVSFPVLFLKYHSESNLGEGGKIYATRLSPDKKRQMIKLWQIAILLFFAGILIYNYALSIFLFFKPRIAEVQNQQYFMTMSNSLYVVSYALMTIGIVSSLISTRVNKLISLTKGELVTSVLLFFLFLLMVFPHYILILSFTSNVHFPGQVGSKLVPSSLLWPLAYYLSQILVSPIWWGTWEGQIILNAGIFLTLSIGIYILLELHKNFAISVLYISLMALNVVFSSLTNIGSPIEALTLSGSLNEEALLVVNIMSWISIITNLVVPVTCLFFLLTRTGE
jgi:hypothetical protein